MLRYEYHTPQTVQEAMALMSRYDGDALFVAGGTDVMVQIRGRKVAPRALISLRHIAGLDHKDEERIGAGVRLRAIQTDDYVRGHLSALHDAVCNLGSIQIRNVATLAGNICNAAPSADTACPLLVLDARAVVIRGDAQEEVDMDAFFMGPGQTVLNRGDMVKEFLLPRFGPHTGSAYIKHTRRAAMDLPIIGVAVRITLDRSDVRCRDVLCTMEPASRILSLFADEKLRCEDVRIAMGVVAPRPMRAKRAESILRGQVISDALLDQAGEMAASESSPRDSVRGEAWYRKEMVRVLVRRAAVKAIDRVLRPDEFFYPERMW